MKAHRHADRKGVSEKREIQISFYLYTYIHIYVANNKVIRNNNDNNIAIETKTNKQTKCAKNVLVRVLNK